MASLLMPGRRGKQGPPGTGIAPTYSIVVPVELVAHDAGGWTTLLVVDASGVVSGAHVTKLAIGIDSTSVDNSVVGSPLISEFRANRTYYRSVGGLQLLNAADALLDSNQQLVVSGTELWLQGRFNAAGGHTLSYTASLFVDIPRIA